VTDIKERKNSSTSAQTLPSALRPHHPLTAWSLIGTKRGG
jgi:hypothetical protein